MPDALLVNPNSPEDVADALKRAISMERDERIRRWRALFENVTSEDVNAWRDAFVAALAAPAAPRASAVAV
jgi:trehalose 6-phosphate synthase